MADIAHGVAADDGEQPSELDPDGALLLPPDDELDGATVMGPYLPE